MADSQKDLKTLSIKAAGVKRIQKEYFGYKKEEEKQKERIDKMIQQNADEYDVNKQKEVLQETLQMYPNNITRLNDAVNDLEQWLQEKETDPLVGSSEQKTIALEAITQAKDFLQLVNPAQ